MKNIFIVPGYGIPKNILKDEPYKRYIALVFNQIYQKCVATNNFQPLIILCGGKTDIFKPYKRTEAGEMKKLFGFYVNRKFIKKYTKDWKYKLETRSLSTVENLIFANEHIQKNKIKFDKIYIFVEFTRKEKMNAFAKKIFKTKFEIIALDFDLSINRYRDPKFIKQNSKNQLALGLKVLQDQNFYKKYRQLLEEKIDYLRRTGPKRHQDALNKWWQQ